MGRDGLMIGEVEKESGASRKALRLYEAAGILPAHRRTAAGYRVYGADTLALLSFVRQAQRLGFSLDEIKEIVAIKRAGRAPCHHVRDLVRRKTDELDRRLTDLMEMRNGLRALVKGWRSSGQGRAAIVGRGGEKRWLGRRARCTGAPTPTAGVRSGGEGAQAWDGGDRAPTCCCGKTMT